MPWFIEQVPMTEYDVIDENGKQDRLQRKDYLQLVTLKLAGEEYGVEITKVKEIILLAGITRVPKMPSFIEGIINLRGNVIPVVDLRKRFGLPSRSYNEQTRIMVTRMELKIVGIIVDSVSEVLKIPKQNIQPPPETIAGLAEEYLVGVGKLDDRMILLLDVDKIVSVEDYRVMQPDAKSLEEVH